MLESCEVSNLLYTVLLSFAVDADSRETRARSGYRSTSRLILMDLNLEASRNTRKTLQL
jgi:hypothetical protein